MAEDNFFDVDERKEKKDKIENVSNKKSDRVITILREKKPGIPELDIYPDRRSIFFIAVECLLLLYASLGLLGLVPLF